MDNSVIDPPSFLTVKSERNGRVVLNRVLPVPVPNDVRDDFAEYEAAYYWNVDMEEECDEDGNFIGEADDNDNSLPVDVAKSIKNCGARKVFKACSTCSSDAFEVAITKCYNFLTSLLLTNRYRQLVHKGRVYKKPSRFPFTLAPRGLLEHAKDMWRINGNIIAGNE